jgi:hypothetical protein
LARLCSLPVRMILCSDWYSSPSNVTARSRSLRSGPKARHDALTSHAPTAAPAKRLYAGDNAAKHLASCKC